MSPAAAALASACSAEGPVVVWPTVEVWAGVVAVGGGGALDLLELPQPASPIVTSNTTTGAIARTRPWSPCRAESRLTAGLRGSQVSLRKPRAHSPDARERTAPLDEADAEQSSGSHPLL